MTFEMLESKNSGTIIKVIGVGGAGSNAVNHMIRKELTGVEFQCANTDAQVLADSKVQTTLQFGDGITVGGATASAGSITIFGPAGGANSIILKAPTNVSSNITSNNNGGVFKQVSNIFIHNL